MKHLQSIYSTQGKKLLQVGLMAISTVLLPAFGYGQVTPPPPTGGSGGGSSPDSPLGVPFDNNLNMLFLLAAVVFATIIMVKMQKKNALQQLAD